MKEATKSTNVKISEVGKAVIMGNKNLRDSLAKILDYNSDRTILDILRDNEWNNKLTLAGCILTIKEMTGLTEEQILETENNSIEFSLPGIN